MRPEPSLYRNMYDKFLTVDSAILETELTPEEFQERIKSKFGLKKKSIKNIFSFGGELKYSGEITSDTFKIIQGNPDNPGFFFFTRMVGKYTEFESGTKVEIKAQYGDFIYYGLIPSVIIWIFFAIMFSWEILVYAMLFIAFTGMYGQIQIKNDFDKFKSELIFYTKASACKSESSGDL